MNIPISCPRHIKSQIINSAKTRFPKEDYCILMGLEMADGALRIENVYFPPDVNAFSTDIKVDVAIKWWDDAKKLAKEAGLLILGDVHSHCWPKNFGYMHEVSPSEGDLEDSARLLRQCKCSSPIFGIVGVSHTATGLRSRLKFWAVPIPLDLKIV